MSCEYNIRPLTIDDAAEAAKLWSLVFGDDESVVLEFFRLFAHQRGFGACAEQGGKIVAAAYCPEEMTYVEPDGTQYTGCYLYAVATHPDHRKKGLAQAVCELLKETARAQGKDYLFTRPSEESLYAWYAEKIDAVPSMGCQSMEFTLQGQVNMPHKLLSPEAYLARRTEALSGLPHVHQSIRWLKWEQVLHNSYSGGFMAVGNHIVDFYQNGTQLQINELLPHPTPEEAEEVCSALMTVTGAESCCCTIHGTGNYVSVAALNTTLPEDNGWFGPCYG